MEFVVQQKFNKLEHEAYKRVHSKHITSVRNRNYKPTDQIKIRAILGVLLSASVKK